MHSAWIRRLTLAVGLWFAALPAQAHQFVLTTGYANSGTPDVGRNIDPHNPPFGAGGGYAVGIRTDIYAPRSPIWWGPQFLYWNNLTGDPYQSIDATYFQMEVGGRISVHSRSSEPTLYAGGGLGYSVAHGENKSLVDGSKQTFDGDFPTASLHIGAKTRPTADFTLLAEGSYHFGLDHPDRRLSVGPASAWMIQIGVGFDILVGSGGE